MHLIDSLEFDVALASEDRAFDEQEQLQTFMRGPALRVIESVFDQVSSEVHARTGGVFPMGLPSDADGRRNGPAQRLQASAQVWRLDRLEIDLGPVSGADLAGQWERRLHDRLLEELRDRLRGPRSAPPMSSGAWSPQSAPSPQSPGDRSAAPDDGVVTAGARRQADLGALQHFLLHGGLPWHLTWPTGQTLTAWAHTVVRQDAPALARQLRRADPGLRQHLTRRLAEQLAPSSLEHLAQALGLPAHWPVARWVSATAQRACLAGVAPAAAPLVRQLWATVLGETLDAPAGTRDARQLQVVMLAAAAGHRDAASGAKVLQAQYGPSASGSGSEPESVSEPEPTAAVLRLRARLRRLWRQRGFDRLDAAMRDSLRSDSRALRAWIGEVGQAAATRRWLAEGLSSPTWNRLLNLLAPAAAPLFGALLRRRPLGAAWMRLARRDWRATRTRLREAALAAVLLDPPAAATATDWLRALLPHAAARLDADPARIWAAWHSPAGRGVPALGPALTAAAWPAPEAATAAARTGASSAREAPAARMERAVRTHDATAAWTAWQACVANGGTNSSGSDAMGFPGADSPAAVLATVCRLPSTRRALAACLSTTRQLAVVEVAAPGAHAWLSTWFCSAAWPLLQGQGTVSQAWALWWWTSATSPKDEAACQRFAAAWLRRATPRLPDRWTDALPPSPAWRWVQAAVQQWRSDTRPPQAGAAVDAAATKAVTQAANAAHTPAAEGTDADRCDAAAQDPARPRAVHPASGLAAARAASDASAQPASETTDSPTLEAALALSLRTSGARARWVGGLDAPALLAVAAHVAPAEAPCLEAWAGSSMWPLWQAPGQDGRAGSPSDLWLLWWAHWAARGQGTGAGFDRAGFVDAWLLHVARRSGLPMSRYLPGLGARLKSLQRHLQKLPLTGSPTSSPGLARKSMDAPAAAKAPASSPTASARLATVGERRPETRAAEANRDDPIALVLRRARALASAPGRPRRVTPGHEYWPTAAPNAGRHSVPTSEAPFATGAAAAADRFGETSNAPSARLPSRGLPGRRRADGGLPSEAVPPASASAVRDWLMTDALIQDAWRDLLVRRPQALRDSLESALSDPAFADELARQAPPALWPMLLGWLRPAARGPVVAAVTALTTPATEARSKGRQPGRLDIVRSDFRSTDDRHGGAEAVQRNPGTAGVPLRDRATGPAPANPAHAWRLVLQHYFVEGRPFVPGEFERRLARTQRPQASAANVHDKAPATPALRSRVARPAETPRLAGLQLVEAVQVQNAGLVLLCGHVPRLFSMLGLTDGRAFPHADAAARAVHLLQWLVDERSDSEEHLLALNKLLCGVPLATPLPREVVLQAQEQDAGRQMLQAMITHWQALGGTSVQGLRETFLQREGRLQRDDGAWRLRVAPRAFDMLLDRLPWGYSTLKLPWMNEVLHVDWR